jgi:ATP-binding cassette subfamily B protein
MDRLLSIQLLKEEKEISEIAFISGNFFFKDFSFKYLSQSKYLIQNLNLVIEKGKTTAIVGESGSGKTTILRLMLGYYSEYEGEMYFGDQIFSNLTPALIRKNISTVMQDGYIFDQSFLYNITLGNLAEIDVDRLKYAIEMANLTSFVTDILRGNLEVKIGINGIKLSGGQKQRILIARAVYKQATYFFFDEATSALDTENESLIMRNLNTHFNGKTVVIVAHRLSTIKHADKIVVMQDGKLVEQGTHEELLAKKGKYLDLIKHQLS